MANAIAHTYHSIHTSFLFAESGGGRLLIKETPPPSGATQVIIRTYILINGEQ